MERQPFPHHDAHASLRFAARDVAARWFAPLQAGLQGTPAHS